MGREVRMVPPGWEHPKAPNGRHIPLFYGFDWQVEKRGKVVAEGNTSGQAEAHAEAREAVRGLGGKAEEEDDE